MSDDAAYIRAFIANHPDVVAATKAVEDASSELIEACVGTAPLRLDRITREERAILNAAQQYRTAENNRNQAVAAAVKEAL